MNRYEKQTKVGVWAMSIAIAVALFFVAIAAYNAFSSGPGLMGVRG